MSIVKELNRIAVGRSLPSLSEASEGVAEAKAFHHGTVRSWKRGNVMKGGTTWSRLGRDKVAPLASKGPEVQQSTLGGNTYVGGEQVPVSEMLARIAVRLLGETVGYSPELVKVLTSLTSKSGTASGLLAGVKPNAYQLQNFIKKYPALKPFAGELSGTEVYTKPRSNAPPFVLEIDGLPRIETEAGGSAEDAWKELLLKVRQGVYNHGLKHPKVKAEAHPDLPFASTRDAYGSRGFGYKDGSVLDRLSEKQLTDPEANLKNKGLLKDLRLGWKFAQGDLDSSVRVKSYMEPDDYKFLLYADVLVGDELVIALGTSSKHW